jgi:hypothetical protein
VRGDSGLNCQSWRDDGWNAEHSGHIPTLVIVAPNTPSKALLGFRMPENSEDLNVTLPCDFASDKFFNRDCI